MVNPRVVALGTCVSGGEALKRTEFLDTQSGLGVVGDRYATGRGFFHDHPDMELTLVTQEAATAVGVDALALRRNVVTEDADLNTLIGQRFRVGETLLEGVRPCNPCAYLETLLARPGLKAALDGRGGLRARVVEGGRIRVGDAIVRA